MSIRVTADLRPFERQIRQLGDKAPVAASRALNRSIASVQTAAVREVAADTKLVQKRVRDAMELRRATPRKLLAELVVTSRRIVLHAFRARQTQRGVSYDLGRGRAVAEGAFIATMRSGHVGVFRRVTRARLPIVQLHGPSLPYVFTQAKIAAARRKLAADLMLKNLAHEVRFLVRGLW